MTPQDLKDPELPRRLPVLFPPPPAAGAPTPEQLPAAVAVAVATAVAATVEANAALLEHWGALTEEPQARMTLALSITAAQVRESHCLLAQPCTRQERNGLGLCR